MKISYNSKARRPDVNKFYVEPSGAEVTKN